MLAITIFLEASGEPIEGQVAVGCVIKNRCVKHTKNDLHSTILALKQFSCWNDPTRGISLYRDLSSLSVRDRKIFSQCFWVASGVLCGEILDNVGGADHYYAWRLVRPLWAMKMKKTRTIQNHVFYKSKGASNYGK